jgi:hypothetical protein
LGCKKTNGINPRSAIRQQQQQQQQKQKQQYFLNKERLESK